MNAPAHDVRKTVTILFCDLVQSTRLAEGDPEVYRRLQARYFDRMRGIVERHGGTVEKFVGDEVMAVFGVPVGHEDDALRAVRAGTEMLDELERLNEEQESPDRRLRARIGINTGEVIAGDPAEGHAFVAGEPVIIAKRLEQAAGAGEILIGRATYRLVAHAVEAGPLERIPVKGKETSVGKRRLEGVDLDAPAVARRLHAPLVGRDEELRQLQAAFERAVAEGGCRLFTVLGSAGIGKSRLMTELLSRVDGRAVTAVGRCLSYGEGITFWPLAEAVRGLGEQVLQEALRHDEQGEAILALLRGVTGGGETGSTEQIFWAVRRAFEGVARGRPLVVCFEDVHWAEPTMLDLVEYVVGWSRGAPILIVALARPDLLEQRPQWLAPRPNHDSLALEPLPAEATRTLLSGVVGHEGLPGEATEAIVAAAEGNPLFAEQLTAMAAEGDGDISVPPSIQALLTQRLDRLSADEREVLERASVVGRDFSLGSVAGFFPQERGFLLTQQLFSLVRKGLIRPDAIRSTEEDRFSFEHVLVRDAAYESMPKELRASLNEHFADWLETRGRRNELEELTAYHLEEAHRHRVEVGSADGRTQQLATHASKLLSSAGSRALQRNDVHAALNLLNRAVRLAPADDPGVAPRLDLGQGLFLSGQLAAAAELTDETAERAAASGDAAGEMRARLLRARIGVQMPSDDDDDAPSARLIAVAEQAREVFAAVGDDLALAEAWFGIAWAQLMLCHCGAMLEAIEHAMEHARAAGSTRWQGELPAWQGTAMFYGPTPVEEALRWYEEQHARHPIALTQQAMLEAMRSNFDEARVLVREADAAAEDFGQRLWLAAGGMAAWQIETLARDDEAAERAVRRSCDLLEELGEFGYRWVAVADLAASLSALGRLDEADELTQAAEEHASHDDVAAQMLWRQVRARVLARRGQVDEAEQAAREAVSLAESTDMLNMHGDALVDLAEVYALGGRVSDAGQELERALALYQRKGNVVAADGVRSRLEAVAARSR